MSGLGYGVVFGEQLELPFPQPIAATVAHVHEVCARPAEHGHGERGRGALRVLPNSGVALRDCPLELFQEPTFLGLVVPRGELHSMGGVLRDSLQGRARATPHAVGDDAEIEAGFAGEIAQLGRGHARGVHLHGLVQARDQELILIHAPHLALMSQAENIDV